MRIFISYSSKDLVLVEPIYLALCAQKHQVFFDRHDLPVGEEYHTHLRQAIENCHLFLFMVSPDSLAETSYSLAEMSIAQSLWAHPSGKILPVILRPVSLALLPVYLKSVTLLQPQGDVVAAVAVAVHQIARKRRRAFLKKSLLGLLLAILMGGGIYLYLINRGPAKEIVGKDGAPAVLIPAGGFPMGDDEESPLRDIFVKAYYLDKHEVTTGQYAKFLKEHPTVSQPDNWEKVDLNSGGNLPVIGIYWDEANAYCTWADKRLPTEAEWEKAARGTDKRIFPWGNNQPDSTYARFGQDDMAAPYQGGLAAVGSYAKDKSPYGIEDLAGNVSEYVGDWYQESFSSGDVINPKGPETGEYKVVRGGGWFDPGVRLKSTRRMYASKNAGAENIGFRCACDL